MAREPLKDVCKRLVRPGQRVILLVKVAGYCKLKDAYLADMVYTGMGPYGYEFRTLKEVKQIEQGRDLDESPYRLRNPECVLYPDECM